VNLFVCSVTLYNCNPRFDVFTAVKIQVEVSWVVTLCSVVVGYQCFGGPAVSLKFLPEFYTYASV
jgi:hypothetical protein